MSLADIFQLKQEVELNGKKYCLEFDNTAYATLETLTGKGLFKIHDLLVAYNNLPFADCIQVFCCGLLKHHKAEEIEEVRKYLFDNIHELRVISTKVVSAFANPLIPPDALREMTENAKETDKKIAEAENLKKKK